MEPEVVKNLKEAISQYKDGAITLEELLRSVVYIAFGLLPGQTTVQFLQEVKALSPESKEELGAVGCEGAGSRSRTFVR